MRLYHSNSNFILGTHKVIPVLGREGPHLLLDLHPVCSHKRLQYNQKTIQHQTENPDVHYIKHYVLCPN